MKALVFNGPLSVELRDVPEPMLSSSSDVRVAIKSTGICGTDRGIYLGKFPARPGVILGHEAVGVVEAIMDDHATSLRVGDRVIVDPTLFCGHCVACLSGATGICENKTGNEIGVDRDGTFADYVVLPQEALLKLPQGMSSEQALLVEPLACVLNNIKAGRVNFADSIAVVGGGPIGLLCATVASQLSANVTLIEKDEYRRETANKFLGNKVSILEALPKDANYGRIFETTGFATEICIKHLTAGGGLIAMGFNDKARPQIPILSMVNHRQFLVGAGDYDRATFHAAIRLIPALGTNGLITNVFNLADYSSAFNVLGLSSPTQEYSALKVALSPTGGDLEG